MKYVRMHTCMQKKKRTHTPTVRRDLGAPPSSVSRVFIFCYYVVFVFFFFFFYCAQRTPPVGVVRIKGVYLFKSHTHTHTYTSLARRPFIFALTGFSCSVSLTEGREGERVRETWRKDVRKGGEEGGGVRRGAGGGRGGLVGVSLFSAETPQVSIISIRGLTSGRSSVQLFFPCF